MATDTEEIREMQESAQAQAQALEATRPARRVRWWQVLVFLGVLGLLTLVALQMRRNGPLAAAQVGAGEKAPGFTVQTFDGQTVSLSDLHGKVVLVNFWASWCIPCSQEAPDLQNTWQQYKDRGVVFVGVDYVDTETEARSYLSRYAITYFNGADLGTRVSQAYRIRGVPETYIVDKNGTLRATFIGPVTQDQIRAKIDPLLSE
jgi:cytochrome c biogenesis protein CcmG/thiol:disulfide interchange protein DsbE